MTTVGFIVDRREIPHIAFAREVAQVGFAQERRGMTFLLEEAIFVNEATSENPTWPGAKVNCHVTAGELHCRLDALLGC